MGDILSKLGQVCDKIGVTERAHTIEEQIDLITEALDATPASTNIAEALDDLSDVAQNINNEEVYVDKTITENGTYLPASDEATAYSKVTVNVAPGFNDYIVFSGFNRSGNGTIYSPPIYIIDSSDGTYSPEETVPASHDQGNSCLILASPVKKIVNAAISSGCVITFTPADNFEGFFYIDGGTEYSETLTGDTITPGDGKAYVASFNQGVYNITKTTSTFVFSIE